MTKDSFIFPFFPPLQIVVSMIESLLLLLFFNFYYLFIYLFIYECSLGVLYCLSHGLREGPACSPGDPGPLVGQGGRRGWANRKPCSSVLVGQKHPCTLVLLRPEGPAWSWPGCRLWRNLRLTWSNRHRWGSGGRRWPRRAACSSGSHAEATSAPFLEGHGVLDR